MVCFYAPRCIDAGPGWATAAASRARFDSSLQQQQLHDHSLQHHAKCIDPTGGDVTMRASIDLLID